MTFYDMIHAKMPQISPRNRNNSHSIINECLLSSVQLEGGGL